MKIDLIVSLAISMLGAVLPTFTTRRDRAKALTHLRRLATYIAQAIAAFESGDAKAIAKLAKK